MVGFGKGEFRDGGIELQLKTLQQDWVVDAAFGTLPTQNAVSDNKLHPFAFTINATVKRIKGLEKLHGGARGLFRFQPFVAQQLPPFKARHPG